MSPPPYVTVRFSPVHPTYLSQSGAPSTLCRPGQRHLHPMSQSVRCHPHPTVTVSSVTAPHPMSRRVVSPFTLTCQVQRVTSTSLMSQSARATRPPPIHSQRSTPPTYSHSFEGRHPPPMSQSECSPLPPYTTPVSVSPSTLCHSQRVTLHPLLITANTTSHACHPSTLSSPAIMRGHPRDPMPPARTLRRRPFPYAQSVTVSRATTLPPTAQSALSPPPYHRSACHPHSYVTVSRVTSTL
nr:extensin-like [Penaeus vannamei]